MIDMIGRAEKLCITTRQAWQDGKTTNKNKMRFCSKHTSRQAGAHATKSAADAAFRAKPAFQAGFDITHAILFAQRTVDKAQA